MDQRDIWNVKTRVDIIYWDKEKSNMWRKGLVHINMYAWQQNTHNYVVKHTVIHNCTGEQWKYMWEENGCVGMYISHVWDSIYCTQYYQNIIGCTVQSDTYVLCDTMYMYVL